MLGIDPTCIQDKSLLSIVQFCLPCKPNFYCFYLSFGESRIDFGLSSPKCATSLLSLGTNQLKMKYLDLDIHLLFLYPSAGLFSGFLAATVFVI